MIVVEYHEVELDYCHSCKGVWLDSGELELLMPSANLESPAVMKDILTSPEIRSSHKERLPKKSLSYTEKLKFKDVI